ncbi:unnamed protein product [Orchesella dallaii]|uniref:DNA ligase 4 n=1 Tax=Orchesella dallaii TaxID=48710 RepID=A0ABP1R290_9HEXA
MGTHQPVSGGRMTPGGRISDIIPFKDVAELLERISALETNEKKKDKLNKFVEYYRKTFKKIHGSLSSELAGGDSMYPILRILLPDVDRGRRAYGFKSSVLGRMFAQILGLDKKSKDGRSLLEFKDPERAGALAGDIGTIVQSIMKNRFSSNADSNNGPTLTDLHEILDRIAKNPENDVNQERQKKILQSFIRKLSPLEGKWLVRILLKEMRLGFSSTKATVYGLLHKQARLLSERIGDLELLCQKLNDPSVEVSDVDISLFNHFCPMLATRMDIIDSTFEAGSSLNDNDSNGATTSKKSTKKDFVSLPPPPFYVETKWDGERFQIHYDGTNFKYLSRRAFDFTRKFDETLTPRLRPMISGTVRSFVMDGEMMAYNKKYKLFTTKGYNIDVKTMNKDNPNHCPVFVAFDLVYFNGDTLIKVPLRERREKLKTVFKVKEDVIRLSEFKTMNSKEQVIETLNNAIDDGEEGLIVKDMNSTYEPGKRGLAWLKIKPEYLEDNMVDDLDLVILGGYYTESVRRGGEITHFLIGLVDKKNGKEEYFPIARVGSGRLRSMEVKDLVKELSPKFGKTPFSNVHYRSRKTPDFVIDPKESIVVQVKASEIIPSDVYSIKYTLRFPRITRIRKDKCPSEAMTVQEFVRLNDACGGKLAQRTDGGRGKSYHFLKKRKLSEGSDDERDRGKTRTQFKRSPINKRDADAEDVDNEPLPQPSTSSKLLSFKTGSLLTKSPLKTISPTKTTPAISPKKGVSGAIKGIFKSKVFCVYGTSTWKTDMETKIRKHGGSITQNPVNDLFAIIGERKTSVLVQKAIRAKKYDVLQPSWILRSIENGEEIPFVPTDYWGITEKTQKKFAEEYDEYGDSYTKENSSQETKELLKRVMEADAESSATANEPRFVQNRNPNDDSDIDDGNFSDGGDTSFSEGELLDELFPKSAGKEGVSWNFMCDVKVALRGTVDFVLINKFEFYGGQLATSETETGVTHVVVATGSSSNEDHPRAFVVTEKWLEDCISRKETVDERRYNAS